MSTIADAKKYLEDEWAKTIAVASDPQSKDKPEIYRSTEKAWGNTTAAGNGKAGFTAGLPQTRLMANGKDLLAELK
ncbi:UNVERIFIED_CONTAM: hypothetical protein HDU68_001771 [Siphonaria sp. JEL0065]|nr:hypothetical protein HDU68_001771 [Siphonaria sp. JEL0065]